MKTLLSLSALLLVVLVPGYLFGQAPSNDPCSNPYVLDAGETLCGESLDDATTQATDGETYSTCTSAGTERSMWYRFTAVDDSMSLSLYDASTGVITNSWWDCAVYHTSSCFPKFAGVGGTGITCAEANNINNNDKAITVKLTSLVVNEVYTVQVTYKPGNSNAPDYCITLAPITACGTCTYPCGAACVFTYPPTQSQVLSSCIAYKPSPALEGTQTTTVCFTFVANKINMNAGLYLSNPQTGGVCSGETWNWSLYNTSCTSVQTGTQTTNIIGSSASPLTVGQTYTLCYTITSSSSCYSDAFYPYVYPNEPLPIQLISFNGAQDGSDITLSWTTETELNNDYFVVQRSTDGINFADLAIIEGNGTSISRQTYSYSDPDPITGLNYYRLAQVDIGADYSAFSIGVDEGKVHLSQQVAVTYEPVLLYHFNLTDSYASIELLQPGQSSVIVFDERGVVMYNQSYDGSASMKIPTTEKRGIWFACLIRGDEKKLMRAF